MIRNWILPVLICLCGYTSKAQLKKDDLSISSLIQPISEQNFFKLSSYDIWCPSVIKGQDGFYHMFYSRWEHKFTHNGWLPLSEIAQATAPTPVGPWTHQQTVLKGNGGSTWDAVTAHNPKIYRFNKNYYLYYIATNYGGRPFNLDTIIQVSKAGPGHKDWPLLRGNQRIGVAVSDALNGPWKRLDKPLLEPAGPIANIANNPAVARGKDGLYYMVAKGDKPGNKNFVRNQAVAVSASPVGKFIIQPKPVIDYIDTEDMAIWYDKERKLFYGIFHSTEGFIGMVCSADGLNWQKAHEYKIMPKALKMTDGSIFKPERMERPDVYIEDGVLKAFYVAVYDKGESFIVCVPLSKQILK